MIGSGAMTGFTAYINFGIRGMIAVGLIIVVFLKIGRMAFGTHAVPVLGLVGPVKPVFVGHYFILVRRIGHVVPVTVDRIPGEGKHLQAPPGRIQPCIAEGG